MWGLLLPADPMPRAGPSRSRREKRGGSGEGVTTKSAYTSLLPGPPSSTSTKDRSLHPEIGGSTAGLIGLISGIAIFLLLSLILGMYLYNRARHRIPSQRNPLPSLSFGRSPKVNQDPYAESGQLQPLDRDITPRSSKFGDLAMGFGPGSGRPKYARQRSSEWEIPQISPPVPGSAGYGGGNGKGKGRENGKEGWVDVSMPNEPDDAAYPLRSRSPRPVSPVPVTSPMGWSEVIVEEDGSTVLKAKGKGRQFSDTAQTPSRGNPFNDPVDSARLSPPVATSYARRFADSAHDDDDDRDDTAEGGDGAYLRVDRTGSEDLESGSGGSTPTGTYESVYVDTVGGGAGGRFVERFQSTEDLR